MRLVMLRLVLAVVACICLAGCDKKDPEEPDPGTPSGEVRVSPGDRLGWTQQAADAVQLASFLYALYVDGSRMPLSNATCTTAASGTFDCSAPIPTLSTGAHTIELATFVVEGSVTIESSRSAALRILFSGPSTFSVPAMLVVTSERVQLNLTPVADGLHLPSDLAFAADGSIFIAERRGTVRVMRDGALADDLALDLSDAMTRAEGGFLALALDPAFGENGFLYALYAVDAPRNGVEFTLARFRYANGVLTERAVLLDRTTASSSSASGALRIGPDGKLYVALDSDSNGRIAASFATYNGKVLRFNTDATTPDDQPASNPIYSLEHPQPIALDWQPATGTMWVVDRVGVDAGRLSAVSQHVPQSRITSRTSYALPAGTGAASAAFYRGTLMPIFKDNLFIAAEMGRQLVRLRFDPQNGSRIVSVERLLQNQIGAVRVVAAAPDGALFIATESVLYRLAP
jgi:glucose/arabinose dehydrogenase